MASFRVLFTNSVDFYFCANLLKLISEIMMVVVSGEEKQEWSYLVATKMFSINIESGCKAGTATKGLAGLSATYSTKQSRDTTTLEEQKDLMYQRTI